MITAPLSLLRQSVFAVSGFLGLLLFALSWGVLFWLANSNLQSQFEAKTQALDDLKRQTGALRANDNSVPVATRLTVIAAPTETIAASDLQKKLLALIEQAGGTAHSIQAEVTNDTVGGGLRRITAVIVFDGSIEALQKILFTLETAKPFIFTDAMTVQPAPTSTTSIKAGDMVRVTLGTSSYWKSFEASATH